MLKVTIKFTVLSCFLLCSGCSRAKKSQDETGTLHYADSVSEARIDSAYAIIRSDCDTLMVHQVPEMVDSLMKDSSSLHFFFDTGKLYTDADKKVEKVVRQLKADCDSSLLKETYRRARLLQRSKPVRRKKGRV